MKRLFFLLATLLTLCFNWASCSDGGDEINGGNGNSNGGGGSSSSISLSKNELQFDSNSGYQTIKVTSNGEWTLLGGADWCDISPSNGKNGETVTINVDANSTAADRTVTFTFKCGNQTAKLTVLQYGIIETSYVDLKIEDEGTSVAYNEQTGETIIEFKGGTIPNVERGQAFVLPETYNYGIRIISEKNINGNKIELKTQKGNMCDLFKDIDFTLTSNQDAVQGEARSAGHRIYTPAKIIAHTKTGKVVLYDNRTTARDVEVTIKKPIFEFGEDFDNYELFSSSAGRLYWEQCNYAISMDGVFTFSFGKETKDGRVVGVPKKFSAELVGNYDANLLLKYEMSKEYSSEEEKILDESILYKTFVFYPNGIPVPITIDTHMGKRSEFTAQAKVQVGAGFSMNGEARWGVSYENGQISPIHSFHSSFEAHKPQIDVEGSLSGKVSFFPSINIKLFDFIGPIIEPMPYVKEDFIVQGTIGEANATWSNLLSSGMDLRLGLLMDFLIFGQQEWKSDIINLKKQPLIAIPARIRPILPVNGTPGSPDSPHNVECCIEGYNYLNSKFFPCPGAWVSMWRPISNKEESIISNSSGMIQTQGAIKDLSLNINGSSCVLGYNMIGDDIFTKWEVDNSFDEYFKEWMEDEDER